MAVWLVPLSALPWRSAESAEVGACGLIWACGAGAGAAGATSEAFSEPQAGAPKMTTAKVAMAAARAGNRRRRLVVFMAVPSVGSCMSVVRRGGHGGGCDSKDRQPTRPVDTTGCHPAHAHGGPAGPDLPGETP